MSPHPDELLNHRTPSPDLAAALDRAPACQCPYCLHRRSQPARAHRQRIIDDARAFEKGSR